MQNLKNEIDNRVQSLFREFHEYDYYKGIVDDFEAIIKYLDRAITVLDDLSYELKGGDLADAHIQDAMNLCEYAKKAHTHAMAFMTDAEDKENAIQDQIDARRDTE